MNKLSLCEYLDWDSKFFGVRIAKITVNRMSQDTIEQVMKWCDSNYIDCLYFLADVADADTVRLAEENKFSIVDIRIKLERQLDAIPITEQTPIECEIRPCRQGDIPVLRAIASVSHHKSRFYYDPNFPLSMCNALYETWIDKSCKGYADIVLVAELNRQPIGYISCHLLDQTKGRIGLFAVSPDSKGNRVGEQLLNKSLYWFVGQDVKRVTVATQGRNCSAQRFYQRCGFLTCSVRLFYHRWFTQRWSADGE